MTCGLVTTAVARKDGGGGGGVSLNLWTRETFFKIGAKWGEAMDFEKNLDSLFDQKRLCIKTKQEDNILEKFKVILKGNVFLVRAKELFAWTPTFLDCKESEYNSDNESFHGEEYKPFGSQDGVHDLDDDSDVEGVSDTIFCDKPSSPNNSFCSRNEKEVDQRSEDPFNLHGLLKQNPKGAAPNSSSSFSHPPGFTPVALDSRHENIQTGDEHNHGSDKVTAFKKLYATVSDNFIAIYGTWMSNNSKVLIVVVYAPQPPSQKRVLWDYISTLIARLNGETIVMGDFNKVRSKDEILGSIFIHSSSRSFNQFITSSGLVDVNLEGYSFTWSHPSDSKMSKLDRFLVSEGIISLFPSITALCLDRHLSDHRPILLREFKKKLQDLKKVIRSWVKDKKLQQAGVINSIKSELIDIDKTLDRGNVSDEILFKRMEMVQQLHDVKQMEARDNIQKSKIKWAIEGVENSKFFHGIINKKCSQMLIRGIFVDGDWKTDPSAVKDAFKDHFAERFKQPVNGRLKLNISFNNRLSTGQVADLDRGVSGDEIRSGVWNCGENKSPGPDGYTFEIFRRYWRLVGPDFCFAVECFFDNGSFPIGSNSSFIALIPKIMDAKFVTDFRPISLIGYVYKVITKILANRLATVDSRHSNRWYDVYFPPFYADDVVIIGEWSDSNTKSIVTIRSFSDWPSFNAKAFSILGVMIGDCMSRKHAWDETIQKLHARLSNWKVKTLSIRGRLTLLKSVLGASPLYNMSIYKVPKGVLNEMETIRNGSIWYRIIQALYGHSFELHAAGYSSLWSSILRELHVLKSKGFDFVSHCKKRVGDVHNSQFWYDKWLSDQPFYVMFPCLFALEMDKEILVASKLGFSSLEVSFRRPVRDGVERQQLIDLNLLTGSILLSSSKDRWICDLSGDGEFRVKVARTKLDDVFLPSDSIDTRWVKYILIKINVFAWRVWLDRLSTRVNLFRRELFWSLLYARCAVCFQKTYIMLFFVVILLRLYFAGYVVGGNWIDMPYFLSLIGMLGSLLFACWLVSSSRWKVFFTQLGGISGLTGIKLFSQKTLQDVQPVRDGVERQQLIDLNLLTGSILLSSSKDRWICDLSGDGEFRVKVARTKLDDVFLPSDSIDTRWVKYILIKINVFAWRVWLDRLSTRVNLFRRELFWSLLYARCAVCFQKTYIMLFFVVILLRLYFAGYVVGGNWIDMPYFLSLIGMLGSLLFACWLVSSSRWKVFFTQLGGISGLTGIKLFSQKTLQDVQ
nr:RNA-directed DNA polymerase, eukaryota [Tanacetum cinerariifolium]